MNPGPSRFSAFRRVGEDRHLRRALAAFTAFSITEYGTWVTVLVYAYSVGDATTVGAVAVAQLVPAALLAPLLAARLDRIPRGAAATVAYASQALSLAATATAMHFGAAPVVTFAFAVVTNVTVSLGRPAHNSLVPELADDADHLTAANVVTTASENIGVFAGPALAGLVMGLADPAAALAALVMVMTLGTGLAATIPRRAHPAGSHRGRRGRLRLSRYRGALPFVIVGGAQNVAIGAIDVLVVLLAVEELGLGDSGAGYLMAALGLGGVAGGLASASMVGRSRLTPSLATGVALRSASLVLIGLLPAAALFLAGTGIGYSVVDVANRTLLQRTVPIDSLAGAFGLLEAAAMSSLALGSALAPVLAETLGTTESFAAIGVVMPVIVLAVWRPLRKAEERAVVIGESIAAITGAAMFSGLEPPVQEAMARAGTLEDAGTGTRLVREGESGDRMWVIVEGSVAVSRSGEQIATLGAGEVFGEVAILSDSPRIATVTAVEPTRLLMLDRKGFLSALATDPLTRTAFEEMARARTRETLGE